MGAFTATTQVSAASGSPKVVVFTALGPASYDTGGSVIDLSVATLGAFTGFTTVHSASVVSSNAAHTYNFIRGAANAGKIVVFNAAAADGGDELANATDISGTTVRVTVVGV
jgi:hypothetical protein